MSAVSRETVRDALATLLTTEGTGSGKPISVVRNYRLDQVDESPLVEVVSAGSKRNQLGMNANKHRNWFKMLLLVYVRGEDSDNSRTDQDALDELDTIEALIADVVADNRSYSGGWDYIEYEEDKFSEPMPITIGDNGYLMEGITLIARKDDA